MQTPDNKTSVVDMQPKGNLPMMKPDDMQYFDKLLDDVDEEALSPEEQKERKIMKLLLKIKNGTPPMRKVNLHFNSFLSSSDVCCPLMIFANIFSES